MQEPLEQGHQASLGSLNIKSACPMWENLLKQNEILTNCIVATSDAVV